MGNMVIYGKYIGNVVIYGKITMKFTGLYWKFGDLWENDLLVMTVT